MDESVQPISPLESVLQFLILHSLSDKPLGQMSSFFIQKGLLALLNQTYAAVTHSATTVGVQTDLTLSPTQSSLASLNETLPKINTVYESVSPSISVLTTPSSHCQTSPSSSQDQARATAQQVRHQSQKESWIKYTSSISSTTSTKVIWDEIQRVSGRYTSAPLSILISDGHEVADAQSIANTLEDIFSHVPSSSNLSPSFLSIKIQAEHLPLSFSTDHSYDYNCPLTLMELKLAIHRSGNRSVGPDNIYYEMLCYLSQNSLTILLAVFNQIWQENVYPDAWRQAVILPILKPGTDPTIPSNYRPIALTSCLSKILEGIINALLVWFFFSPTQCGFRRQCSTIDHLICLKTSEKPF
ncbi:uncharacterized protein LOC143236884 [Tachypleus tridentatus]|uniref:uncharacterized protein LOC143236884 n=1 Tax=Tachypleus tridentatus TaxID=6853 RepID=UPI003FD0F16F